MKKKLLALTVLVIMLAVVVLLGGIYQNTKPQEEYEVIVMTGTLNATALDVAGYIDGGYIKVTEDNYIRPPDIEKSKFIYYDTTDNVTDNFTVVVDDDFWEWWYEGLSVRGRGE